MAKTAKDQVTEMQARENEYLRMRKILIDIVFSSDASNSDRIAAINSIYQIDVFGIPH